jgi:hypothetical protein
MNVVLISTTDVGSGRSGVLERMVQSVAQAAATRPDMTVSMLLLLQRCPPHWQRSLAESLPPFVRTIAVDDRLSLSAARNRMLELAAASGLIAESTVVGFPDDDCWYPAGVLEHVIRAFEREPRLDMWFSRYSSTPTPLIEIPQAASAAGAGDVIRNASSNTMFVRGRILRQGVAFDEALGVGTRIGGGEDTEFALCAHLRGGLSLYLPAEVIGHRDKNPGLRAKYYGGALIAIARHAGRETRVTAELARKLAVGVWLVLSRQLPFAAFTQAVAAAVRSRRAA